MDKLSPLAQTQICQNLMRSSAVSAHLGQTMEPTNVSSFVASLRPDNKQAALTTLFADVDVRSEFFCSTLSSDLARAIVGSFTWEQKSVILLSLLQDTGMVKWALPAAMSDDGSDPHTSEKICARSIVEEVLFPREVIEGKKNEILTTYAEMFVKAGNDAESARGVSGVASSGSAVTAPTVMEWFRSGSMEISPSDVQGAIFTRAQAVVKANTMAELMSLGTLAPTFTSK